MYLVNSLVAQRKLKPKLGVPDVYPQDPNQKEDELSAVHVKQGFSTTYANLLNQDEYGSGLSKVANFNNSKIWNSFKDILAKKEDLNTMPEIKDRNKRQHINIRDDFWLVTAQKKQLVDKYFKDLAGEKPLAQLAKKVPVFNRRDEIIRTLCDFDVPVSRGVWLIKMNAAHAAAMQENNKSKKKVAIDPGTEWTVSLIKFIQEQREQLQAALSPSDRNSISNMSTFSSNPEMEITPDNSIPFRQLLYAQELCWYMYQQGLLDRQEFLQSIIEMLEKHKNLEDPLFRMLMPTLLRYSPDLSQCELLSRRVAYQCAKKITHLVVESEAYNAALSPQQHNTNNNPQNNNNNSNNQGGENPAQQGSSTTSSTATTPTKQQHNAAPQPVMPPVLAGLIELQNDPYYRIIVLTLSSVLQSIVMECPTALVWNYCGENKMTPSFLIGSPLDHLPNVAPSSLPMPPRADNQQIRARLRLAEMHIKERSASAESSWTTITGGSKQAGVYGVVGKILSVLEELDKSFFDKMDSNNCLDVLSSRIWGPCYPGNTPPPEDEAVVSILCDWVVTNNRSGEHRAFVAAKLLEARQTDLLTLDMDEDKEEDYYLPGSYVFQDLLFKFLDTEAPFFATPHPETKMKQEMANLVLFFHELMTHDVFSHDGYMCSLITRGDLNNPIERGSGVKEEPSTSAADTSDDRINTDLGEIVKQITENKQLDDFAAAGEQDNANNSGTNAGERSSGSGSVVSPQEVWRYNRHWQYTYHFPIPFSGDDSAAAHDINQRHVLLYGSGRGKDEMSKQCKKITKEILKLFSKRFSIDVNEGGKVKKHHKSEFIFNDVVQRFQDLSFFDQHVVTNKCGQAVIEMLQGFHSCTSVYLPVMEHISFLFDLAGQAYNIQSLLDWCFQILKELPQVEAQLIERSSVLVRTYTTGLAVYIVGVLRRYFPVLVLNESDTKLVWDALVKIAYRHSNMPQESPRHDSSGAKRPPPNLDCISSEWVIMAFLYDLATACPGFFRGTDKYSLLRRLFNQRDNPDRGPTISQIVEQFRDLLHPYIQQPRKKIDPLIVRYLHEKHEHQFTLVYTVLSAVIVGHQMDTDKLNDLAIFCCEVTAQCNALTAEWLAAFYSICCGEEDSYYSLLSLAGQDQSFHAPLGVFASVMIARQCFSMQSIVVSVLARSLVKAWNKGEGNMPPESEPSTRLSLSLLMRFFRSVESFQPGFYTVSSPRAIPVTTHDSGIKFSCDRHLFAATRDNVGTAIPMGFIIAVLKALVLLVEQVPRSDLTLEELYNKEESSLTLGDLAYLTLRQICSQEWVRDRCLQVPEDLCKTGFLLDNYLPPQQTLCLLRQVCHTDKENGMELFSKGQKQFSNRTVVKNIIRDLDVWSLRASLVEIKVMYLLEKKNGDVNYWLEEVSQCIVESFQLGEKNDMFHEDSIKQETEDSDSESTDAPAAKKLKLGSESARRAGRKFGPIWMIPHLVKNLKFLQTKILHVSGRVLDKANWSRCAKDRISVGHQPFLQLVLTCIRELEGPSEGKSKSSEDREQIREHLSQSLPEVREQLLHSIYEQLAQFLCFNQDEKVYNYEDFSARKIMQDALKLRFSLLGGMFEATLTSAQTISDWAVLLGQLITRGVTDLTNNSDLYCTVIDMLTSLIHKTLVIDRESAGPDRAEENKRNYLQLVKRLKKEIGEKQNPCVRYLRQLLPIPKQMEEVIVTEQYGLIPDSKGVKVKGFNCDKKQGLQVSEKQKVSPWDILEGHKNPAPLSWHWFQATRIERKPMRYEEAFQNMKYMKNNLQKPSSHYLDPPPLPAEDLQTNKDLGGHDNDKSNEDKLKMEHMEHMDMVNGGMGPGGKRVGPKMGQKGNGPNGPPRGMMMGMGANTRMMTPAMAGPCGMMGGPGNMMGNNMMPMQTVGGGGGGMMHNMPQGQVGMPNMMNVPPGGGGGIYQQGPNNPMGGGGYNNMSSGGGGGSGMMIYDNNMGYSSGGPMGGGGGVNQGMMGNPGMGSGGPQPNPQMYGSNTSMASMVPPQNVGSGGVMSGHSGPMGGGGGGTVRFPGPGGPPGMSGPKQALQNMIRNRNTSTAGQFVPTGGGGGGPPTGAGGVGVSSGGGPNMPGSMMRPGGGGGAGNQYGGPAGAGGGMMGPGGGGGAGGGGVGQTMGGGPPMGPRSMYPGNQMNNPGMNYGMGHTGVPGYGGFGGAGGNMRPGMSGQMMRAGVPAQQYGMSGPMQSGMRMAGMGMARGPAMMNQSGRYGMPGQGGYGMQGSMGMSPMMRPGMNNWMTGMSNTGGMGMQNQSGMMQGGGGAANPGAGGAGGGMQGPGSMMGGQPGSGSQLMAHLQRGNSMQNNQQINYQQNRY